MTVTNSSKREVRASLRDGCAIHVGPSCAVSAAASRFEAPAIVLIVVIASPFAWLNRLAQL